MGNVLAFVEIAAIAENVGGWPFGEGVRDFFAKKSAESTIAQALSFHHLGTPPLSSSGI